MKVVYIALELGENENITAEEIALLFGVDIKNIKIKPMCQCKANERFFAWLTDLYLWTNKYWYGLFEEKLTFIFIKGVSELNPFFQIKYSTQLRFSISADSVAIFPKPTIEILNQARQASLSDFNSKRINAIKPFIKDLKSHYKILFLSKNPFTK